MHLQTRVWREQHANGCNASCKCRRAQQYPRYTVFPNHYHLWVTLKIMRVFLFVSQLWTLRTLKSKQKESLVEGKDSFLEREAAKVFVRVRKYETIFLNSARRTRLWILMIMVAGHFWGFCCTLPCTTIHRLCLERYICSSGTSVRDKKCSWLSNRYLTQWYKVIVL